VHQDEEESRQEVRVETHRLNYKPVTQSLTFNNSLEIGVFYSKFLRKKLLIVD
jgi:hypothetical protein